MRLFRLLLCVLPAVSVMAGPATAEKTGPPVGQSEKVYTLARENTEIRGLAVNDRSSPVPELLVLDASRKLFVYRLLQDREKSTGELTLASVVELPGTEDGHPLTSPRGLAFATEGGQRVVYFLNWSTAAEDFKSQLWRFNLDLRSSTFVDLSLYGFRIGDRELLDVARDGENIFVCFDASGYTARDLRVQRGIVQLKWHPPDSEKPEFFRHLPDAGTAPSRGLACMELDGARYFWATIENDYVYCADALSGRGLFHFERPKSAEQSDSCWGLCFGADSLWVSESVAGPDRVHRVNVTKNLDASREGTRVLRHLTMTIETEPEGDCDDPGKVYHNYSRPYASEQLHNQGVWAETESVVDVSGVANATVKNVTLDPGGDVSSRQYMSTVEYTAAPARQYSSRYEIDLWTNPYRKFVYPHRVNRNVDALAGTDYLADDPDLFNLSDTKTYDAFFERVKAHILRKYGVEADLKHPYWAARCAVEYIQDTYYYPNRAKRKPAAVDYRRKHYDANPGNLKIELSNRDYDKSQIIACSGTSVMLAGAMRHLGIPARWLGTGTQFKAVEWDTNGNGLLDEEETARCSSGHRYTQVWLGSHYGWICFDGTPSKPDFNDYDPPPPLQPQLRFMQRAAAGHRVDNRIVFNVGSTLIRQLYRDFEYDEELAVDNNCGGDQRYNLQGRFEKPELWKLAGQRIYVKCICYVENVLISGPKDKTRVTWKLKGQWDKDPGATVSVFLSQLDPQTNESRDIATLAKAIPHDAGETLVDISSYNGKLYRITIRKDGDPQTGGQSETFDIE